MEEGNLKLMGMTRINLYLTKVLTSNLPLTCKQANWDTYKAWKKNKQQNT